MKNFINKVQAPCNNCPYKLGIIQTVTNPCPQCKLNHYQSYEVFKKQLAGNDSVGKS